MSNPIAIFYHARLFGGEPTTPTDHAARIMADQMELLRSTGLLHAATEFTICNNGSDTEGKVVSLLAPEKALIVNHGAESKSHLPTMDYIRRWLPSHRGWYVLFFHMKGSTHPDDDFVGWTWRKCMERATIRNWMSCIADLDAGYETVGAHWISPEKFGPSVPRPFWGGAFWWAKESLLSELPQLPVQPSCRDEWFLAERWIGSHRNPQAKDYAPHWPNKFECWQNACRA